ncbi:MAG TPA: Flp pilus assembly protein CpaB [Candidatus Acidoferrum sp.]|nr:Flp pilus assembly protein CpaB [Candidatus Acidoferrum sp.]
MGTRRLGFALVAALVISLGITSVFYVRISRTQASTRTKTKRIIAASVALQPGTPITAENLTEINWPVNVPLDGLIEKKEDVVGHVLMYAVAEHQPVLHRDLAANASLGLSAKIPDGMRATAVKTNEVTNIAGFIFPGSHVDVLVTLKTENSEASMETHTVLQNVQVLSTGTKMDPDPNGKPENVNVVTLLVTPEQSEKLALAQHQGTIHFVLRNGGDSASPDVPSVDMAELAGIAKKPQPEMRHPRAIAAVKPPQAYIVETLANGKITVSQFPVIPQ